MFFTKILIEACGIWRLRVQALLGGDPLARLGIALGHVDLVSARGVAGKVDILLARSQSEGRVEDSLHVRQAIRGVLQHPGVYLLVALNGGTESRVVLVAAKVAEELLWHPCAQKG